MDVRTLCLGVLLQGDSSGYDIKKHFEKGTFSHFCDPAFGSIYPALAKLTKEGLVNMQEKYDDGRPKKIYSITDAGILAFTDRLNGHLSEDTFRSDQLFALFHAEILPKQLVADILSKRQNTLEAKIAELTLIRDSLDKNHDVAPSDIPHFSQIECRCTPDYMKRGRLFLCDTGLAVMQAELAFLQSNSELFLRQLGAHPDMADMERQA